MTENKINQGEESGSTMADQEDGGGSFADLLARQDEAPGRFEPGQQVDATVVRISNDWIFLDLGGKSEGSLSKGELVGKDGQLTVQEGDRLRAYFLSANRNGMLFTTRMGGAAARAHLEEAFRAGIPMEGFVEKEVKGGYEVKIAGNQRAFCPFSQTGLRREQSAEGFIGAHHTFRITEFGEKGRNILVSRRAVLEEEGRRKKEELRGTLELGQIVAGTVTRVLDFGAFVDIGGLEGLLPISEIGWSRVEDIHAALHEGQQLRVVIKKLDWDADRFAFSLKDTLADPWEQAIARFPVGSSHTGTVARLTAFGAFVTLAEGIDGLVHISQLGRGKRINHPREAVEEGQALEVIVEGVDPEKRRLSLALPGGATTSGQDKETAAPEDDYRQYAKKASVEGAGSMGTLGDLLKGGLKGKK